MNEGNLRKSLAASLEGGNAHVSLKDAIENVNPELRGKRPSEGVHSIWELLEHIRLSQEDILRYTVDADWKSPDWPKGYWPAYPDGKPNKNDNISDQMWEDSINKFNADLNELISLVNNSAIDLTSIIPHTSDHTYLREIILVIDHNSYHVGQIVSTRKILGDWKE